jgi:hypothetical protein
MFSLQCSISRGTRHALRRRFFRAAHGRRELGNIERAAGAEIVIGPRRLSDGPATEAMVPWVRGKRDGRETVVVR